MIEMKPCPFCGGTAKLVNGCVGSWMVQCLRCHATSDDRHHDAAIECWNTRQNISDVLIEAETVFAAIQHGDDDHRAWLREALDAVFAGKPVPEPRGSGRKEALIDVLTGALETTAGFCIRYARFIREHVRADDLEMHPYLPAIEVAVEGAVHALHQAKGGQS